MVSSLSFFISYQRIQNLTNRKGGEEGTAYAFLQLLGNKGMEELKPSNSL